MTRIANIQKVRKGTFLSDIVPQILSFVAENERGNIRQRQTEGIAAAKVRGGEFGWQPHSWKNFPDVYQRWKSGRLSNAEAAEESGMPITSLRYQEKVYQNTQS